MLSTIKAIILGMIQGLTEFLPVSSSGHLVLFRGLLDFQEGLLTFEILLHLATALSVIIVFWSDIKSLFKFREPSQRRFLLLLVASVVPTAVMGILFEDYVESLFSSPFLVGLMLIVTGFILFSSSRFYKGNKDITNISFFDAVLIGIGQGIAIIPGVSRSGMTIVTALSRRMDRELAAKYSFILSLPVILGAGVLRGRDLIRMGNSVNLAPMFTGALVALIVGYYAIKFLTKLIAKGRLHYFSFYCWSIGLIVILQHLFTNN